MFAQLMRFKKRKCVFGLACVWTNQNLPITTNENALILLQPIRFVQNAQASKTQGGV